MSRSAGAGNMMVIPYGDQRIRCEVRTRVERRRRSIAIHVEPDGRVLVDAPEHAVPAQVRQALMRRARWIHRHLHWIAHRRRHVLSREYVSGEAVYYLGRRYRLKLMCGSGGVASAAVRLRGGQLQIASHISGPSSIRAAIHNWYRERAREVFRERLEEVCQRLRWVRQPPQLALRTMRGRWGSCSSAGRLTLNPALVRAPRDCIDYVIIHELCHLRRHNHGKAFYRLLESSLPGWQRVKARLDEMAERILAS
ncbi:MAG: M48 family metallopeptidase [Pseudomonadota bacterium]|nr:M48 family metallopeptidase [Pseudomonadota bacterium]